MFIIDTPYVNECFRRAISDGRHAIHVNDTTDLFNHFAKYYNFDKQSSHVVTNSGDVFELAIARDNRYVTLIHCA